MFFGVHGLVLVFCSSWASLATTITGVSSSSRLGTIHQSWWWTDGTSLFGGWRVGLLDGGGSWVHHTCTLMASTGSLLWAAGGRLVHKGCVHVGGHDRGHGLLGCLGWSQLLGRSKHRRIDAWLEDISPSSSIPLWRLWLLWANSIAGIMSSHSRRKVLKTCWWCCLRRRSCDLQRGGCAWSSRCCRCRTTRRTHSAGRTCGWWTGRARAQRKKCLGNSSFCACAGSRSQCSGVRGGRSVMTEVSGSRFHQQEANRN